MRSIWRKISILSLVLMILAGSVLTLGNINRVRAGRINVSGRAISKYVHRGRAFYQAWQSRNAGNASLPANTEGSLNWSGYIVSPASSNKSYTSVSASWTVPDASSDRQNAMAAQWIGLGGVATSDLLQAGTLEQTTNGQTEAVVFWEKLPSAAQNIMTVPVGSVIDMYISKASGSSSAWDIKFTAKSSSGIKSKTISVTLDPAYEKAIGTSAEWINEDPSNGNNELYPLADTGTVNFEASLVNGQPINASGNVLKSVALVSNSGNIEIAPSAIGKDGESFSTTYVDTSTVSEPTPGNRERNYPKIRSVLNRGGQRHLGHGWQWEVIFRLN